MSLCTNCKVNKPNDNKKWCQQCFVKSKTPRQPTICTKCQTNPANIGFSKCQQCFIAERGETTPAQVFCPPPPPINPTPPTTPPPLNCSKCNQHPANIGFSKCQQCFLAERGEPSPAMVSPNPPPPSSPPPTLGLKCSKCENPPNPGYTLCQACYKKESQPMIIFVINASPSQNVDPLDPNNSDHALPSDTTNSGNTGNTVPSDTTTQANTHVNPTPGTHVSPPTPKLCSNCKSNVASSGYSLCQQCYATPKLCSNCKTNTANSGYSLCPQCYNTSTSLCTKCFTNTPTPGKSWCRDCWEASKKCAKCKKTAPNAGKKWCQPCFNSKNTTLCKKCMKNPHNNGFVLCQSCFGQENELKLISTSSFKSNKYQTIEKQFQDGMAKKQYRGTIVEILSVYDKKRNFRYESYKQIISKKNNGQPNEKRWWHGSNLGCDLWVSKQTCNGHCHICNILKSGFLMKYANTKNAWGRFGAGLYFAPDAAKSNDYAAPYKNVKCLILCKVVVGNARVFIEDQPTLTGPPPGFDSVLGKPGTGGVLNFPELVLYTEEAMLPAYVVFYK